ncbi:sensor histidine kinase [Sediminibacterium ginsengisoli]|uniref:histidine kinase n=1 Tax=Sediminibacterium ginsengisoli TaxID=413434 RepID=A0A1T4KCA2_9BACT|nr:PAS domain-containing sensor histidine kinase [Sediminibacterium ginsengisoli]SJZ40031.1 hypothetical protein SAMN04488132_101608 [Sediminibacterium ginsengisoli]
MNLSPEPTPEHLQFAIEAAELGTWDLNPFTNSFTCNALVKEWFGLPADTTFVPLSAAVERIAPGDQPRIEKAIAAAMEPDSDGRYDVTYAVTSAITGKTRVLRAKGKTLRNEKGELIRFNGILQDITAETEWREQEQKLLTLIENSVDLMSVLDMNGINSYINPAGKNLLGIPPEADITTIPIKEFHTPEQLFFVETEIIPAVMTKKRWSGQFAIKNGESGEIIPLYNNCHRIDDPRTGEPIGIGAVMRDLRPELAIRNELEKNVQERTKELQEAYDALEKRNKELASFAYVSSHDLQEPLRKIQTFVSRLQETEAAQLSDKARDYFERIRRSANRMQTLINDLLSYAREDSAETVLRPADLNQLIAGISSQLQEELQRNNATLTVTDLPVVQGIPFQLQQLFINLFSNALKFARPDVRPEIKISATVVAGSGATHTLPAKEHYYHHIRVEDNGIGFRPEYAERIFEVFQRLHPKTSYEGSGIGLAICRKIMEKHKGAIYAEGQPDQGAVFHIYIPV